MLKYCTINEPVLFAQECSWQAANVKRVDSSIWRFMHDALVHINNTVYIFYSLMFISFFLLRVVLTEDVYSPVIPGVFEDVKYCEITWERYKVSPGF